MAEGGDPSSTVRGSDTCFEYTCVPCADEGDIQEALKYCLECKEYLCATCVKHHQKFSATKKHTLHDKDFKNDSINSTPVEDKTFKCLFHPDRDIEMYCGVHEMVYCLLCIAKEHRQCNGIILELKEAAEKIPVSSPHVLLRQIDSLQTDIQKTRQERNINLISLDHEKNDILKTIADTENLIIEKVKELASDAKTMTSVRFDDLKKEIQKEDTILLKAFNETNGLRNDVESHEELDTTKQFVRHVLQKHSITQTQIVLEGVEKDKRKMKCFKNEALIQEVLSANWFVQIVGSRKNLKIKDNQIHIKAQYEVEIKRNGDMEICSITGICQLLDGTVILADRANKKLKKLKADFTTEDELDLESNPTGLCLFEKSDVAVKFINHRIVFYSLDGKWTKKQTIEIEGGDLTGFACISNELWCSTCNGIKVYNKEGIVLKTFDRKSFEGAVVDTLQKVFPVTAYEEFIYVSDLNKKVLCIDREGNVWSVMESNRLHCIRRACISQNGIIFLAGFNSGNVMIFDGKGNCLGELVDGLDFPDTLCYDSNGHQLIVGHRNKDILTIIKTEVFL